MRPGSRQFAGRGGRSCARQPARSTFFLISGPASSPADIRRILCDDQKISPNRARAVPIVIPPIRLFSKSSIDRSIVCIDASVKFCVVGKKKWRACRASRVKFLSLERTKCTHKVEVKGRNQCNAYGKDGEIVRR